MRGRKLPPLLVGTRYQCPALQAIEFTAPDLASEVRGEATAVIGLTLANETHFESPVRAFLLHMLMASLIRAFPQQALATLRLGHEPDGSEDGPGQAKGARKG